MSRTIDLNADLGEYANDEQRRCEQSVMHWISSCHIACGGHVGSKGSVRHTIDAALANQVVIGAHPSYPDPEGFGRRSLDITPDALRDSLQEQLTLFAEVAGEFGLRMNHLKPHGALYNDAAANPALAELVVETMLDSNAYAALVGPPNSALQQAAMARDVRFLAEGFVDRAYEPTGQLRARQFDDAMIESVGDRVAQAIDLAIDGWVRAVDGGRIEQPVRSLCLHGDSEGAVATARAVHEALLAHGCEIQAAS